MDGEDFEEEFEDDEIPTEVCYRLSEGDSLQRRVFDSQKEASAFVDGLLEGDYEEILWRSEGQEDFWQIDLDDMYESLIEGCPSCDAATIWYLEEARASALSLAKRRKRRSPGHNPFKYKSKLGPGPRGGKNSKSDEWTCKKSGKYSQICRHSSGYKKRITIDPGYKSAYNKEYRSWRAAKTARFSAAAKKGHARRREAGG
jgi:hypothetical protein